MFTSTNNYLLDLRIKECEHFNIAYKVTNNILYILKDYIEIVGCDKCYGKKPFSTPNGYAIDTGPLINYFEKYNKVPNIPMDIAKNCWLCPKCNKLFRELMPRYEYLEVKDVSL